MSETNRVHLVHPLDLKEDTMKRIVTCAAATAIALGTIAAPAHAATVNVKDKDGMCTAVSYTHLRAHETLS